MPTKESSQTSATERVRTSYRQLNIAAKDLNTASDEFKEAVSVLDSALERLNLGVASWVLISSGEDEDGTWQRREIGYVRIGKKWGIAIRHCWGDLSWPQNDNEEQWLFSDAPRWMRIEAVAKIPDLLDGLTKQAEDTTQKLKKRTEQVFELATAMSEALDEIDRAGKAGDQNA
jgi:hypothetical protein